MQPLMNADKHCMHRALCKFSQPGNENQPPPQSAIRNQQSAIPKAACRLPTTEIEICENLAICRFFPDFHPHLPGDNRLYIREHAGVRGWFAPIRPGRKSAIVSLRGAQRRGNLTPKSPIDPGFAVHLPPPCKLWCFSHFFLALPSNSRHNDSQRVSG